MAVAADEVGWARAVIDGASFSSPVQLDDLRTREVLGACCAKRIITALIE